MHDAFGAPDIRVLYVCSDNVFAVRAYMQRVCIAIKWREKKAQFVRISNVRLNRWYRWAGDEKGGQCALFKVEIVPVGAPVEGTYSSCGKR